MKKALILFTSLLILGGCQIMPKKTYTREEIMQDGSVDIKKAEQSAYLPYEKVADNILSTHSNNKATNYLENHYEEIVEIVTTHIENNVGQKVEIIMMEARFPYMAISIKYKTIEGPLYTGITAYEIDEHLGVTSGAIQKIDQQTIKRNVLNGLYEYAYQEELNQLRTDISIQFQNLISTEVASLDADSKGLFNPFIKITSTFYGIKDIELYEMQTDKIYQAYIENKNISQSELKTLFDAVDGYQISIQFFCVMKDTSVLPTKELWNELYAYIDIYEKSWMEKQDSRINITGDIETNYQTLHYRSNDGGRPLLGIGTNYSEREE